MQGSYDIVLDSKLGERCGTLTIDCTDGKINGVISLVGFDNAVSGELRSGVLYLCHELSTIVSTLKCSSVIQLIGEKMTGTVSTGSAVMKLHGTKKAAISDGN